MSMQDENAGLERTVGAFDYRHKIAYSAGHAERLLKLFEGVSDPQHAPAIEAITEALEQAWSVAVTGVLEESGVDSLTTKLESHLEDEEDPGFTWLRPMLNDTLVAALFTLQVVSTGDVKAALGSRAKLLDTLDYIAELGAPPPTPITGADYAARGDLPFFTEAKRLLDHDVQSSAEAAAHRTYTTAQGDQLLRLVNEYRAGPDWDS